MNARRLFTLALLLTGFAQAHAQTAPTPYYRWPLAQPLLTGVILISTDFSRAEITSLEVENRSNSDYVCAGVIKYYDVKTNRLTAFSTTDEGIVPANGTWIVMKRSRNPYLNGYATFSFLHHNNLANS